MKGKQGTKKAGKLEKPRGAGANARGAHLVDEWLRRYEWSILSKFQEILSGQAHEVRLVDK